MVQSCPFFCGQAGLRLTFRKAIDLLPLETLRVLGKACMPAIVPGRRSSTLPLPRRQLVLAKPAACRASDPPPLMLSGTLSVAVAKPQPGDQPGMHATLTGVPQSPRQHRVLQ